MERGKYNLGAQGFPLQNYWIAIRDVCRRFYASANERTCEKQSATLTDQHTIWLSASRRRLMQRKFCNDQSEQMSCGASRRVNISAVANATVPPIPKRRPKQNAPVESQRRVEVKIEPQISVKGRRRRSNSKAASRFQPANLKSLLLKHLFLSLFFTLVSLLSCQHHNVVIAQSYDSAYNGLQTLEKTGSSAASAKHQQQVPPTQAESKAEPAISAANDNAACFGGLQTFEKISMSTFESPSGVDGGGTSGGSFGSGILIQQDDQALTSECINLCRAQSNCLSFVIDYNKFECKSYATTQQELQQEFASRFQAARAANSSTQQADSNSDSSLNEGYQTAASSSQANIQQLLPSASSNYFEKICLDGVANRNQFSDACGQGRLWTIERVVDSFLDGFVEKEVTNVNNKDECSKLCIFETQFVCRSADYDQQARLCRLSKEDRRTQPQAMRFVANSQRQYLENQCATPGPSSCVYETKRNVAIISMDALKFAQTAQDCQMKCNQEATFNCRSYSFHQQRCFLSGDDSTSLNSNLIRLPTKQGWSFGEKRCLVELCTKGIFSYEKITGFTLRSALSTSIDLMVASAASELPIVRPAAGEPLDPLHQESSQNKLRHLLPGTYNPMNSSGLASAMMMLMSASSNAELLANGRRASGLEPMHESASSSHERRLSRAASNLAITEQCRHTCDLGYLNCPAFTIDYKNNRCQRLDRNSQGRHHELVARDGSAYYEKICLRVPEIMSMCQDKYWIFERVLGYELAPRLYDKTLKFVQSRRDCEEYCLEEKQFQCRSAFYNDETSDCKLSRYNRRLAIQEGAYYRNFNARISYLENNCVRDHELETKRCYYEQAKDEPSYPTFTERIEMANPLPAAAAPSESSQAAERHNTSQHRYGASFCEQLCNDNSNFECHSFGYYASTAQCFLSGDDSISAGEMATTPSTGFTYHEKKCRLVAGANPPAASGSTNATGNESDSRGMGTIITTPSSSLNPYFGQPPQRNGPASTTAMTTIPMGEFETTNSSAGGPQTPTTSHNTTSYATPPHPAVDQHSQRRPYGAPSSPASTTNAARPSDSMNNSAGLDPDLYKCGLGHTYVYQRISGFEPIGGLLTLLVKNNEQPGIVTECAQLCKRAFECRAFVVDYDDNQCFAMLENSSVGLLSLRQTLGKDYFEGFCLPDHLLLTGSNCRNKTWLVDKIVDQAVVGVQHQRLIPDSDRFQCRQACLEERLFWCKSAMFDSATGDCKLFSIDRESMPQMRLLFTKGVDFFENQCQISSNSCPYDAIERDMTIITATKSLQARSTFDCEIACNLEASFNCRSYTYLDQYPSLPNLCLLSPDSRSTSQRGSVKGQPRTLYAERNCYYRKPRYPSGSGGPGSLSNSLGHKYDSVGAGYSAPAPSAPLNTMDAYRTPATTPLGLNPELAEPHAQMDKYPPAPPPRIVHAEQEAQTPNALSPYEPNAGPSLGLGCESHQFTFERTFGYDFKLAPKERAPIAPTIGIAIGCQQECLRRADKCQSFVVEYALPYQSCFLIETLAGANKKLLVKSPNSVYFEKVCLPRTGLQEPPEALSTNPPPGLQPIGAGGLHQMDAAQALDTSPNYGAGHQDPWSAQVPNQLPYYLQQQQLLHNYPSRACSKLWSFERFVNHNFTAPVDRVIENALNRAQCETHCLNEASFSCRAATYDYANRICRLFKSTRRTILSQLVDLEAPPNSATSQSASNSPNLPDSHPGTAHVITETPGSADSIHTSASSLQSNSLASHLTSDKRQGGARQLAASLQTAEPSNGATNIDYLENTCTPEPSSCQYRQFYDQFSPYIDKVSQAVSLGDCQRQCDQERLFGCKSLNYDPITRKCMLVNEDLISLDRGSQQNSLLAKKSTIYSEKGNCEMISVQCNSQEMLVAISFDSPFRGRVMAKGNPEQCFMLGDGQSNLQFSIVFGPKCNSRQEGHNTFVNEVVIQQHPVIMTESDKTVRVMCAFEAPDQTITLKNPMSRDNKTGIDVGAPDASRTRNDRQHFNSVVSNKAAPPSVILRILEPNGRDASMINLGDDLMLKIQMQMDGGRNSALGIFARNLAARSSNGESLLLIDNDGCPADPQVFPALEVDPKDGKSLVSTFKAFRFPSSGLVNFEVQIRFCPERCQPVDCHKSGARLRSYGRRRRKRQTDGDFEELLESKRAPILQSASDGQQNLPAPLAALDSLSTVMKPGKAFEYVRKLMLPPSETTQPDSSSEPNQPMDLQNQDTSPNNKNLAQTAPETQEQPSSEEFESQSNSGVDESSNTRSAHDESSNIAPQVQHGTAPSNQQRNQSQTSPSHRDSIVPHVDEKLVESMDFSNTRGTAPYGRFPSATVEEQVRTAAINNAQSEMVAREQPRPTDHDSSNNLSGQDAASKQTFDSNNYVEKSTPSAMPSAATLPTLDDQQESNGSASDTWHPVEPQIQRPHRPAPIAQVNGKELPLRFSILVGENQAPTNGRSNPDQPSVLVMNSTSMDLDHIVIPGKKGESDDGDHVNPTNSFASNHLPIASNYPPDSASHHSQTETAAAEIGRHRLPGEVPSKRTASYEQTFDALSSNSISSELHMNHNSPDQLDNAQTRNQITRTGNVSMSSELSAAAGHDCQIVAGKSRLRTIIWTGGIVIALNICLVILSLVLYFRKVHLRQTQTIVSSNLDCSTTGSNDGGRWPSVILKSKNKLGTSLNAHEHFFCKLNGSRRTGVGVEHDFNWPNLSSSSSRSTVSSLASPVPSTSIRVNQMRPSLKSAPFDAHSTLRSGNFNTGNPKDALSMMDRNNHRDEYSARYTENIDILHSERF